MGIGTAVQDEDNDGKKLPRIGAVPSRITPKPAVAATGQGDGLDLGDDRDDAEDMDLMEPVGEGVHKFRAGKDGTSGRKKRGARGLQAP